MDERTIHSYRRNAKELAVAYERQETSDTFGAFCAKLGMHTTVLDAGCAAAYLFHEAQARNVTYFGIDLVSEFIDLADARATTRVCDVRDISLPSAVFDGVWCSAVLQHIDPRDHPVALKELVRVVKPGGIGCISVEYGTGEYTDSLGRLTYRVDPVNFRAMLEHSGASIHREELSPNTPSIVPNNEPKNWLSISFAREGEDPLERDDCPLCPSAGWPNVSHLHHLNPLQAVCGDRWSYVSPDIAPIGAWHFLFVPNEHTLSWTEMRREHPALHDACLNRLHRFCERLRRAAPGSDVLLAEHGPLSRRPGRSCIAHTHIHVLMMPQPNVDRLWRILTEYGYDHGDGSRLGHAEGDYVLFERPEKNSYAIHGHGEHPPQEIRRLVAQASDTGMYRWQDMARTLVCRDRFQEHARLLQDIWLADGFPPTDSPS